MQQGMLPKTPAERLLLVIQVVALVAGLVLLVTSHGRMIVGSALLLVSILALYGSIYYRRRQR